MIKFNTTEMVEELEAIEAGVKETDVALKRILEKIGI